MAVLCLEPKLIFSHSYCNNCKGLSHKPKKKFTSNTELLKITKTALKNFDKMTAAAFYECVLVPTSTIIKKKEFFSPQACLSSD